jgi:small ligand-binding sensory domain FIST
VLADLGGAEVTLAVVFATPELLADDGVLVDAIGEALAPRHLIGCTAEATIAEGREIEGGPALTLWAAHLPGAAITPFALHAVAADDGVEIEGVPEGLEEALDTPVILLADPFTFPADAFLDHMNGAGGAARPVVGGLASGGRSAGEHRLIIGRRVHPEGAVGVALDGVRVTTVVSQGCRPVGPDMVVTAADGPIVEELAGRPAVERLEELIHGAGPEERGLLESGLLAGLVIDENRPDYRRGDYLIRGVRGADRESGSLLVGERVRVGQTLRFQARDAGSADADLREALAQARRELGDGMPAGALVFTCNGRGTNLFDVPNHDAMVIRDAFGDIPTGGLFCNGEIGPVGGRNFLHGFTATMAVFTADDV